MDDSALAVRLALTAGEELLRLQTARALPPDRLAECGDLISQKVLAQHLADERPQDAVLSEEGLDDRRRLVTDRVWIVDPLDGTREFGEGRDDWAVHVALWEGGDLTAGAVAVPARGLVLSTAAPPRLPAPAGGANRLRVAVSRTRPPEVARRLEELREVELVPMGSAGVKTVAVLTGEVDAYVHAGGQYEWDSAAPVAVARAAGAVATRLDGSPLRYNGADPLLPDLLVVRPEHARRLRRALDAVLSGAVQ